MEEAIQTVVKVFLKSGKGKESLGPKDFQNLVKSQLGNILTDTDSKEAVNNMGKGLDANKDGKVGFEEYMRLVGYLAKAVSEQRCRGNEAQPDQKGQSAAAENAAPDNAAPKAEAPQAKLEADADGKMEVKLDVKTQVEEKNEEAEKPADLTSPSMKVTAPGVDLTSPGANVSAPAVDVTSAAVNVTSPSVAVTSSSAEALVKKEIPVAGETETMVEEAVEKMANAAEEEAKMKAEGSATSAARHDAVARGAPVLKACNSKFTLGIERKSVMERGFAGLLFSRDRRHLRGCVGGGRQGEGREVTGWGGGGGGGGGGAAARGLMQYLSRCPTPSSSVSACTSSSTREARRQSPQRRGRSRSTKMPDTMCHVQGALFQPGKCHADADQNLPQVLGQGGRQVHAEPGRAQGTVAGRAGKLLGELQRQRGGGEDHDRPGREQRRRGGLHRVHHPDGRPHRRLQRLLPGVQDGRQAQGRRLGRVGRKKRQGGLGEGLYGTGDEGHFCAQCLNNTCTALCLHWRAQSGTRTVAYCRYSTPIK